jgi:hypothetical protein
MKNMFFVAALLALGSVQASSHLRVVHAVENLPSVDVYLDDILIDKKVEFMNVTPFRNLSSTLHTIRISPVGTTETLLEAEVEMAENFGYTLELTQVGEILDSNLATFDLSERPTDQALLNLYHLAPIEGGFDLKAKTVLFEDIAYLDAPNLYADPFKGKLALLNSGKSVAQSAMASFEANKMYSIFIFESKNTSTGKGIELKIVEDVLK